MEQVPSVGIPGVEYGSTPERKSIRRESGISGEGAVRGREDACVHDVDVFFVICLVMLLSCGVCRVCDMNE